MKKRTFIYPYPARGELIDRVIDCIAITNCQSCEKNIAGDRTPLDKKLK